MLASKERMRRGRKKACPKEICTHECACKKKRKRMKMNNKLTKLTKYVLDFMFFSGIVVTITLPFSFQWYGKYNHRFEIYYWPLLLLFFLSGLFAIQIIQQLRKMFQTVLNNDCFVKENIKSLQKMGTYSFFIAIITSFRLLLYITPAVFVIIIVFLIAGLFSKVLAQVFETAVNYKLENDLTI